MPEALRLNVERCKVGRYATLFHCTSELCVWDPFSQEEDDLFQQIDVCLDYSYSLAQ